MAHAEVQTPVPPVIARPIRLISKLISRTPSLSSPGVGWHKQGYATMVEPAQTGINGSLAAGPAYRYDLQFLRVGVSGVSVLPPRRSLTV